jgi:hypothetical protein
MPVDEQSRLGELVRSTRGISSCQVYREAWLAASPSSVGSRLSHGRLGRGVAVQVHVRLVVAVGVVLLGAVAGDMTGLSALVAALASGAKGAAVGSRAVARDVAQLAARVAFDGLRLAVTSVVVGPAALVAGCGTSARGKTATTVATSEASAGNRRSTATESRGARVRRVGARADVVAELTAIMATAGSASAAKTKGRAVGLDVAQALAVIALLGFRGARQRAFAGLVI